MSVNSQCHPRESGDPVATILTLDSRLRGNDNLVKEKFLLHVCCGPCSIAIFQELQAQFDVTVHFYNPNIHPATEYEKRKAEVVKLCSEFKIPFVEEEYKPEEWFKKTVEYKNEPEGGKRCPVCFAMRLEKVAEYSKAHGFTIFSTSLTMGRNKKAAIINPIGVAAGEKYGVKFYEADWKKNGRTVTAEKMINERGIYRQNYCGCAYSKIQNTRNKIQN